jgi:hypothetical protein
MARPRGPLRQTTTATTQALPMGDVRTSHRSALAETRRITATAAIRSRVLTSRRSGPIATRHPTIITAAIRSSALTIRHPHARTRRRELIPLRAAAIPLRLAPIRHPAAAIAAVVVVEVAAAAEVAEAHTVAEVAEVAEAHTAVEVVEVHTAVEAPALTAITNLFADSAARLDAPGGPFVFHHQVRVISAALPPQCHQLFSELRAHNSSGRSVLDEVKHFVVGICCFDMGKMCGKCSLTMECYCLKEAQAIYRGTQNDAA